MKNQNLTPIDWQRHVERCCHQGSTQADYCRRHNLILSRFGYWHRKLNSAQTGDWLPVEIESSDDTDAAIDLVLDNGRTLRITDGFDKNLLQQVIVAVEATP